MNFTINLYSTALFATWINVEELDLLIDAGDGLTSSLTQKSRKIKNVFITHPDRDHLTGLHQFIQLNARKVYPVIHYPKDSGSFPALARFLEKFDPHISNVNWRPISNEEVVSIKPNFELKAIKNEHIETDLGVDKSFSYQLFETKRKLKPEFMKLSNTELKELGITKGGDFLTEKISIPSIGFSGDTPVDDYEKWNGFNTVIHEATFLESSESYPKMSRHSTLEQVMKMVSEIDIDKLILTHFSSRYSHEEIKDAIRYQVKKYNLKIPIWAVLPGEFSLDILATNPLN